MKLFLTFIFLFPCLCVMAQETDNYEVVVDQDAHYPGGEEALIEYVLEHVQYPPSVKGQVFDTNLMLSFDVMPDSTLSNFTVLSSVGNAAVDKALVDVLRTVKFAPSVQNGVALRMNTMLTIPVRVKVGEE